ncbi:hypothetical protein [Nitrososphaera viennensis]|uniref:Uncharacterized protein n=1 Tax=Nitrososphaera viennensis TaxID=1034015 RepID=A0A977IFC7_9ARCH|nr:hypothetical protein [Nitrososphaera viennensis]UVS69757.1 hypothetical protein NWT39_02970 [Nitrososphaera viennensis]
MTGDDLQQMRLMTINTIDEMLQTANASKFVILLTLLRRSALFMMLCKVMLRGQGRQLKITITEP